MNLFEFYPYSQDEDDGIASKKFKKAKKSVESIDNEKAGLKTDT